jgi:hypothetical protein
MPSNYIPPLPPLKAIRDHVDAFGGLCADAIKAIEAADREASREAKSRAEIAAYTRPPQCRCLA